MSEFKIEEYQSELDKLTEVSQKYLKDLFEIHKNAVFVAVKTTKLYTLFMKKSNRFNIRYERKFAADRLYTKLGDEFKYSDDNLRYQFNLGLVCLERIEKALEHSIELRTFNKKLGQIPLTMLEIQKSLINSVEDVKEFAEKCKEIITVVTEGCSVQYEEMVVEIVNRSILSILSKKDFVESLLQCLFKIKHPTVVAEEVKGESNESQG